MLNSDWMRGLASEFSYWSFFQSTWQPNFPIGWFYNNNGMRIFLLDILILVAQSSTRSQLLGYPSRRSDSYVRFEARHSRNFFSVHWYIRECIECTTEILPLHHRRKITMDSDSWLWKTYRIISWPSKIYMAPKF